MADSPDSPADDDGTEPDPRLTFLRRGRRSRPEEGADPRPDPAERLPATWELGRLAYRRPVKLRVVTTAIIAISVVALVLSSTR